MYYFDCHADTLTEIPDSGTLMHNSCCLDLARVRAFADRYTQIFAIWQDRAAMPQQPEEAFQALYERAIRLLEAQKEHIAFCRSARDMQNAHAQGLAAAFLSIEDISIMGSLAPRAREYGFRFAMLSWNYENSLACGAVSGQHRGLTAQGLSLAKHLLAQNLVLDISHLSDQGAEDIFQLTERPVIASHSNARDICAHPRNLKKEHIQEFIRRKGLVGLNLYRLFIGGKQQLPDLLRHIDAILELGGEDILALGADFDGCGDAFPQGINGVQSMPHLKKILEQEQFGRDVTEKIFWKNAQRFVLEHVA